MLKGLSGSGWHLCSIMMRMMFDGFIGRTASLGSPGVNELRWLAPLRPGDDLTLDVDVAEAQGFAQPSRHRHRDVQGRGPQRGGAGAVRDGLADHRAAARRCRGGVGRLMRFFEDIEVGQRRELGSFTFTAELIKKFASAIRSAALSSRRGRGPQIAVRRACGLGLACRIGLHEAAGGRRPAPGEGGRRARREGRGLGTVAGLSRVALDQAGAGGRHHQLSPARSKRCARRRSVPNGASLQARNTGTNQRGELVFSLLATAFVPRRNAGLSALDGCMTTAHDRNNSSC